MGIRIGCQEGELLGSVTVNEKDWKECKFEITQIKAVTESVYYVLEEGCLDFAECWFDMCI